MKIEQNPFSLYDFLGYFVPGSILTYSLYYFLNFNDYSNILEFIKEIKLGGIESYLPFIILSYSLGQAQSFLSSYTIERFCIWHYSYPFRFLMNFSHDGYINIEKHTKFTIIKRVLMLLLLLPISFYDILIDVIFKVKYLKNRKLSPEVIKLITYKFNNLIKKSSDNSITFDIKNQDNFLLIYHYTIENSKNHISKFNNYVALYGFSRSISFLLILNFWGLLIYQFLINNNYFELFTLLMLFIISLISYIFYLSYCKFLRRYSMEVIMTFLTLPNDTL